MRTVLQQNALFQSTGGRATCSAQPVQAPGGHQRACPFPITVMSKNLLTKPNIIHPCCQLTGGRGTRSVQPSPAPAFQISAYGGVGPASASSVPPTIIYCWKHIWAHSIVLCYLLF